MPPVHTIHFKLDNGYVVVRHPPIGINSYGIHRLGVVGLFERVDVDRGVTLPCHCCHKKKQHHHKGFGSGHPIYHAIPARHSIHRSEMSMADLAVAEVVCIALSITLALLFLAVGNKIRREFASKSKENDSENDSSARSEYCRACADREDKVNEYHQINIPNNAADDDDPKPNIPLLQKY
ncbi:hypothetical protein EV175_001609 [Coemansia sp. RSA 1933]|nr:hypothetical protein EV175_001609 [Coemansia sp. RSA 1933]